MTNTNKLLADFNRYFTSGNDVDVPERVSVPRDEWRELHAALAQPAQPSSEDVRTCSDCKEASQPVPRMRGRDAERIPLLPYKQHAFHDLL